MRIYRLLLACSLAIIPTTISNDLLAENNKKNIFPKETSREYFLHGIKQIEFYDDDKSAIENYEKALDFNPKNIYALLFKAESNWRLQNYDIALNDINTVLEIDPDNKYAIYDRAKVNADAGNYLIAIKHYSESIEKGIELEYAFANRGTLNSWTGNAASACSDWQASISSGNDDASEYSAKMFKKNCEDKVFSQFNKKVKMHSLARSAREKFDLGNRKGACKDYFEAKKYGYKSTRANFFEKLYVNSYCFFATK